MIDKYELKETLQNGIATVTFTKADGTLREMRCTLMPEHLPPQLLQEAAPISEKIRAENPNALAVWDLDANGWRSFRLDSISLIEVEG